MKKVILVLFAIIGAYFNVLAQNYSYREFFNNDKLGIYNRTTNGKDRLPGENVIEFDNYTNNNVRVTYKVSVTFSSLTTNVNKSFTYTNTIYINPKSHSIDWLDDSTESIKEFFRNNSKDALHNDCRVGLPHVELINYGVEQKSYETAY